MSDFRRIDDRTGFKVWAARTSKEWTGLITTDPDPRHPQDTARGKPSRRTAPNPSPEPADTMLSPNQITADSF